MVTMSEWQASAPSLLYLSVPHSMLSSRKKTVIKLLIVDMNTWFSAISNGFENDNSI